MRMLHIASDEAIRIALGGPGSTGPTSIRVTGGATEARRYRRLDIIFSIFLGTYTKTNSKTVLRWLQNRFWNVESSK